jgi:hypothetical protein
MALVLVLMMPVAHIQQERGPAFTHAQFPNYINIHLVFHHARLRRSHHGNVAGATNLVGVPQARCLLSSLFLRLQQSSRKIGDILSSRSAVFY